jgi:hypothetical protein
VGIQFSPGWLALGMPTTQDSLTFEQIRQHPGAVQVTRKVVVSVPGKHFPQLTAAEQKQFYYGTAVEFTERHKFAVHYDWKYKFLRPTIKQVVTRYKIKFHNLDPAVAAAADVAAASAASAAADAATATTASGAAAGASGA